MDAGTPAFYSNPNHQARFEHGQTRFRPQNFSALPISSLSAPDSRTPRRHRLQAGTRPPRVHRHPVFRKTRLTARGNEKGGVSWRHVAQSPLCRQILHISLHPLGRLDEMLVTRGKTRPAKSFAIFAE